MEVVPKSVDDATDPLLSVRAGVFYLVLQDRIAWGNEISRYRGQLSLVTTVKRARQVAQGWRSPGANFTIMEAPGLVFETVRKRIGMIDFHSDDSFADWDPRGAEVLRAGTPIELVIEAFGQTGSWKLGQAPSVHSIVHRRVEQMEPATPLGTGSFTTYQSSFGGSRQPINWSHQRGAFISRGTLRIVAEFERVNSPEVVPPSWTEEGLRTVGFEGFTPFDSLPYVDVPTGPGVYAILRRPEPGVPEFLPVSSAGWFKGKDPTVPVDRVTGNWVPGPDVVYIGKADGGAGGRRGLRKRLDEFRRHGAGEHVGHWGGRMIWQLANRESLLVCWLPCEGSAEAIESRLLSAFEETFHSLPFANLKRGRS